MTSPSPRPMANAGVNAHGCEAGLDPGTTVLTMDGAIPVEFLSTGDRLITRRGVRKIKAILRHHVPEGTPRVVISADALGGKPATDITLMPGQRVLIRDWRAQALWGKDIAAPQAARLVDGEFIRTETTGAQVMLSLYFGAPEIIYADGLELTSADLPSVAVKA
ncbi:Hint domain-containing protein [Jannaschia sp. CCS1]|uniref:Hint domain-containing protein n=1 Tax=Jannaschia sp. (strain CCS1) TaxID=290400 RepID=UPI00140F93FA|nr:Hint domain-containing protein [Jannaschia sp. CCS1]